MKMLNKKIVFLTGTRADFGKLKSLITILEKQTEFNVHIFVTGMHLLPEYGYTVNEIVNSKFSNITKFDNSADGKMEMSLSKTIEGFSNYLSDLKPDLVVVHGDRLEALAGAIVSSINNTLVAHIEGGEISGTIDESIRHAISKFSHIHFTSDEESKQRLIKLGENPKNINVIGSPDLDLMNEENMEPINKVKEYYEISFNNYGIVLFHPVTTEIDCLDDHVSHLCQALISSKKNYIVIYPNNDLGNERIIKKYKKILKNNSFKIFPSLRFEYFLTLLKHSDFLIGNSSCGLREAPFFGVPSINIGTRQMGRSNLSQIINVEPVSEKILKKINQINNSRKNTFKIDQDVFIKNSDKKFLRALKRKSFWITSKQKHFFDQKAN